MAGTAEPTWSRPPPAVPSSPSLTRLGRWGRWLFKGGGPVGRAASAIFDASPTAMPWVDEVPRDDFERALFAKARELEAQGVDRDQIQEWFRGEQMVHAKTKEEDKSKTKIKSGSVRISFTRIRCYKLDRHLGKNQRENQKFIREFCRQLREQEERINQMTRKEWESARQHYKEYGRAGDEKIFRQDKIDEIRDWLIGRGKSPIEAQKIATDLLDGKAPLHVPDQVLGGHLSEILRMGSAKINSVIGGGWPSRLKEFERHAKNLKPDEKMKIDLCATIKGQDACRGK